MKRAAYSCRVFLLLLLPGSVLLAASSPAAERSALIRRQIDELLAIKRRAAPLPVDPPDPFALPTRGGAMADLTAGSPPPVVTPPAPDPATITQAEQLARLATRLRISGLIRIKDQLQIVINDIPYKEGDVISVEAAGRRAQLQLVRLAPGQLTLRFEDAELTQKF